MAIWNLVCMYNKWRCAWHVFHVHQCPLCGFMACHSKTLWTFLWLWIWNLVCIITNKCRCAWCPNAHSCFMARQKILVKWTTYTYLDYRFETWYICSPISVDMLYAFFMHTNLPIAVLRPIIAKSCGAIFFHISRTIDLKPLISLDVRDTFCISRLPLTRQ